jgi:hypothetical protein
MSRLNTFSHSLVERLEKRIGQSLAEACNESLSAKRSRIAAGRSGKPMRFTRNYPVIGRGCVLGDHLISTSDINKDLDRRL